MPEKFMPYQPTSSVSGRKIVVTMVRICMMRFCRMSISDWNSDWICVQYSRSSCDSSRRRMTRSSNNRNSPHSSSEK